jgi:hypothetical protein
MSLKSRKFSLMTLSYRITMSIFTHTQIYRYALHINENMTHRCTLHTHIVGFVFYCIVAATSQIRVQDMRVLGVD